MSLRWRLRELREIPRRLKWAWQRARRGYADCDVWSFDMYLARVIADGIGQLRQHGHSYPADLTPERWDAILAEIEEGARIWTTLFDIDRCLDWTPDEKRKLKRAGHLMVKWFGALWD